MSRKKYYQAVLFSSDGDWVTDYHGSNSIEEVWKKVEDQGSKWIFYPFVCVTYSRGKYGYTTNRQKIVDSPFGDYVFVGRTIAQVSKFLKDNPDYLESIFS
jgi:hypothetical protein